MTRRYRGARELVARTGTCRGCGKTSLLSDFVAREYLAPLGVPLLPLGTFHVRDRCAACGRHQRVPLADYRSGLETRLRAAERAVRKAPSDPGTLLAQVRLLRSLGRNQEALATVDLALRRRPADPDLLFNRGELLEALLRLEDSAESLAAARAGRPESFAVRLALGRLLLRLGRLEEALEELREARRIDSRHPAGHWLMGQCCMRLGRRSDALRHYEELLGRCPELRTDATVWRRIGDIKQSLGYKLTPAERKAARARNVPLSLVPSPLGMLGLEAS